MSRRSTPLSISFALAFAVASAIALLLGACGGRPPETLIIERLDETQLLFVDADSTVGDPYRQVEVLRSLSLEPEGADGLLLKPLDVHVRGALYRTDEDGDRVHAGRSTGLDRSAQAATQAHLTPFWASARVGLGDASTARSSSAPTSRLDVGLLLPDGSLFGPSRAPADDEPAIDDAAPFQLRRVPDDVLALVAAHAVGAWAPGEKRTIQVEVGRGMVLPHLTGTLMLRRLGGRSWTLHLEVDWRAEGKVAGWLAWRVVQTVEGFVSVRSNGRLHSASLSGRAQVLDGTEEVATARHRLILHEAPPHPKGHEADDLARLLALRAEDETAFDKAVLVQSAASAHALVQRVRPEADLEHISVFLSDQVKPTSWPSGRHATAAGIEDAIGHWERWAPQLERLLGPGASEPALAEPGASEDSSEDAYDTEAEAIPGEEWWMGGGAAWTHVGVLTAGREVVSNLHTLAHEYAHFASDRFAYSDLERIGIDWDAEAWTWVDLDGLLAASVLEEAQAEATAVCAVHACFTATQQRTVIRWYGAQDTRPTAEADFRDRLYATAYGRSPAVLAGYCEEEDDLEQVIAKTWTAWPYRTQAILFPRDPVHPSRLWDRAQTLADQGAVDATRVGAFTLLFLLDQTEVSTHEENLALVRALEDDVLLRAGPDGLLWVTRWRDEAAAERFFECVQDTPGARSRVHERRVTVRVGRVPKELAWRRHLLRESQTSRRVEEPAVAAPKQTKPNRGTPK